jgi:4-hydroxyphenylacetate 3-monooxygenase
MGLRTGQQYLDSLKDGRKIVYNGKVIDDVTKEEGFANTAKVLAEFYDFQNLPSMRDVMTYETEDGERAGLAFIEPRSKEDLRRRAAAYAAWAEVTAGFMSRGPDYLNTALMMVGSARKELGVRNSVFGDRAYQMYKNARQQDLFTTSTFLHVMVDRFKKPSQQSCTLRVTRETSDGVYVSGSRALATSAPFGNIVLSIQLAGQPLEKGEEDIAVSYVIPINSPGLTWICRDVQSIEHSHFNAPLSSRIDEMDCIAVFEDCFIPWENIIIYKDLEIFNKQPMIFRAISAMAQQALMRFIAKTRFMFGLAHMLAESSQVNKFINVQERLGDFVIFLQTLESLAIAAVEGAFQDPNNGIWYPNIGACCAAQRLYPEFYPIMVNHLVHIGASGYFSTTQEQTLDAMGIAIEEFYKGANSDAHEKVGLFRLGWDVAGSTWGRRQDLYERFFFGDPQQWKARVYNFDLGNKASAMAMVKRILQTPNENEPFPIPDKFKAQDLVGTR